MNKPKAEKQNREPDTDVVNKNINLEIKLLLEAIYQKYGYDFRNYGQAHIKRRVLHRLSGSNLKNISELIHEVIYNDSFIKLILEDLSITVTEMFRDPTFYKRLREEIIPLLKTYPYLKIWHAGCSTGQEVYSMAIILKEEKLFERTQIYATDFNQLALKKAREGIYPIDKIKEYTRNYQRAGGKNAFSDYYTAKYESVILDSSLKKNIVFAEHNLVTDNVFAEVNLVICRNVLIYFNKELQERVLSLFEQSLMPGGYLCLGSKESLRFSSAYKHFQEIDDKEKIYKKNFYLR
ncbi:MAG: protein-glutamate O-methyltransferase CheR [Bacteroidales bacterium]|nr:protein-glutamate O-methyltransferase CheR [Bacteroidales bacterium]MCF8350532.1 protein-glutamate O-methyltransferase CheR [Bacteroidales bacterium]MCF8375223.1 protein-glutamate O-methyltransferase CheR [Bacteroidales bacterium]MCF8400247.1 protein-glutamate O-methyltransferase CheR [Bacteroidales bacterium]